MFRCRGVDDLMEERVGRRRGVCTRRRVSCMGHDLRLGPERADCIWTWQGRVAITFFHVNCLRLTGGGPFLFCSLLSGQKEETWAV